MSVIELKPHEQRVVAEKVDLDRKIQKLRDFLTNPIFAKLEPRGQELLRQQLSAMQMYSNVVGERLRLILGDNVNLPTILAEEGSIARKAQDLAAEARGNVAERDYEAWAKAVLPVLDFVTFTPTAAFFEQYKSY